MKLNEIKDNNGATGVARRIGRGIGSGWGKTSARGHKGQYARGGVRPGFEGGQTPLYRRMPKRGFTNIHAKFYEVINTGSIQKYIDSGKLDSSKTIDAKYLKEVGILNGSFDGVRLLAKGNITSKATFLVNGASKKALEMVEKIGGKVELIAPKPAVVKKNNTKE